MQPFAGKILKLNKYSNESSTCRRKHLHDSIGEARYCDQLDLLVKAKEIKEFKIQVDYPLVVNKITVCVHRVDFEVTTIKNKTEINEFKGFATQVWNLKRKLFKACYPGIPYIVVRY